MKMLDIALKDLLRYLRTAFLVVMMFVVPLLMTGIFYFAFGGQGSSAGFNVPVTRVQIVNLDRPPAQPSRLAFGEMLIEFLQHEKLATLLQVTIAPDGASAREAVKNRSAEVAVIIPANFTSAALTPGEGATITIVQDPARTLGPGIVKGLISQFVDGLVGAKIAASVVMEQFGQRGIAVQADTLQNVAVQYAAWAVAQGQSRGEGKNPALELEAPPRKVEPASEKTVVAGWIMTGMMIFFVFYTGAGTAESIIQEDEEGTLARLFTTPTPHSVILGGKFIGVFITIIVQLIVLLIASALAFGIHWGELPAVVLLSIGLVVAAAGFGVFVMSFVKNMRQAGPVVGGVLTLSGMVGGLFTTGIQNLPAAYETIQLLTPHGWALRGWKLALAGGGVSDVLLPALVMLAMGAVYFAVGAFLFRKRFA